jgi:hypothetical protein
VAQRDSLRIILAAIFLGAPLSIMACPPELPGKDGKDSKVPVDLNFHGRRPGYTSGNLHVEPGVAPDLPVVFEPMGEDSWRLRPARMSEHSDATRPVYRFAWQPDGSARFHELVDPARIDELESANTRDIATPAGAAYENQVMQVALQQGKVLQECVGKNPDAPESLDFYVQVDAAGKASVPAVVPEGDIGECIERSIAGVQVEVPPSAPFTAEAVIRVKP